MYRILNEIFDYRIERLRANLYCVLKILYQFGIGMKWRFLLPSLWLQLLFQIEIVFAESMYSMKQLLYRNNTKYFLQYYLYFLKTQHQNGTAERIRILLTWVCFILCKASTRKFYFGFSNCFVLFFVWFLIFIIFLNNFKVLS